MTCSVAGASSRGDAGFSLVEVLVALMLVSVLAGTMVAMTGQYRRLIDSSDRIGEQLALQAAARHMARLIEEAELVPLDEGNAGEAVYLYGSSEHVKFSAVTRLGAQTQGLRTVSFEVTENRDLVQTMVVRRTGTDRPSPSAALMVEAVQTVSFSYFGSLDSDRNKSVWHGAWSELGRLPLAVSVSIRRLTKGGRTLEASDIAWLART
jgi:prepilin-type N-terminal cleavage/methylation domain-containing protein